MTEEFARDLPECDILMQLDNMLEGGLENVVIDLALALEKWGWRVAALVLGRTGEGARKALSRGLRVAALPYSEKGLRAALRGRPPKLILAHYSFQGCQVYAEFGIPFIQVLHNVYCWFSPADLARFKEATEHTALFVAVSEAVRDYSLTALGIPADKCRVIANGIEAAHLRPPAPLDSVAGRAELGFNEGDYIFLAMGSISRHKRQLAIVKALHAVRDLLPQAGLLLAGYPYDQEYAAEIQAYLDHYGLNGRVRYVGHAGEPERYYRLADCFVHASAYEGGQLVLLEALAANLAVATTEVGFARQFALYPGVRTVPADFALNFESFARSDAFRPSPGLVAGLAAAMLEAARKKWRPHLPGDLVAAFAAERAYAGYERLAAEYLGRPSRAPQNPGWPETLADMARLIALRGEAEAAREAEAAVREAEMAARQKRLAPAARRLARALAVEPLKLALSLLPHELERRIKQGLRRLWRGARQALSPDRRSEEFKAFLDRAAATGRRCVVIESSQSWAEKLFQRPQQLALAFGRLGYPVVYKDPVAAIAARKEAENLWVVAYNLFEGRDGFRILLSTYEYPEHILRRQSRRDVLVYDYIDAIDEKINGRGADNLVAQKMRMFAEADIVTASAASLYEEALASARGRVALAPNGVDAERYFSFTRPATPPAHLAAFLARYPKKIVGYFGALAPWLDYGLINALLAARRDLGFVFIGPDYDGSGRGAFAKADNLLLTGAVDYAVLPEYALWFDICWIPFEPGEVAKSTSPLKLFEYFALGKPVVAAADLRECAAFPQVFLARDAASFSLGFDRALARAQEPGSAAELKRLAEAHSWLNRALVFAAAFQAAEEGGQ